MSLSRDLLSKLDVFEPEAERSDTETLNLWALVCYAEYIEKVGWIDHTCDWDLAFEITFKEGQVIAVTGMTLHMENGEEFNMDTGVNELIHAVRITTEDTAWTQPDDLIDKIDRPWYILLDSIERIGYT